MEFNDVNSFHQKFDLRPSSGGPLDKKTSRKRADVMREELREFEDACEDGDRVKAVDALIDIIYFAYGAAVLMGITAKEWELCWDAVHAANMTKERSGNPDGTKAGIEKPAGWVSPNGAIAWALSGSGNMTQAQGEILKVCIATGNLKVHKDAWPALERLEELGYVTLSEQCEGDWRKVQPTDAGKRVCALRS